MTTATLPAGCPRGATSVYQAMCLRLDRLGRIARLPRGRFVRLGQRHGLCDDAGGADTRRWLLAERVDKFSARVNTTVDGWDRYGREFAASLETEAREMTADADARDGGAR